MTIASQTTAETMLGDGSNRQFPFTFRAWEGEVRVVLTAPDDTTEDVTGLASIVHNSAEEGLGGIVTYPAALEGAPVPAGYKLTVLRDMDFLQPVRLINAARYDPVVIEQELDRLTAMIQQVREVTNRSAQLPIGTAYTAAEFLDIIYEARAQCMEAMEEVAAVVGRVEGELDAKAAEAIAAMETELQECLTQLNGLVGRAEDAAVTAEDAEAMAKKWATNPENVPVTADPQQFSAFHWAKKAKEVGSIGDANTEEKGIAYVATAAEVAAGVTDSSRDGAAAFVTPETMPDDLVTQDEFDAAMTGKLGTSQYNSDRAAALPYTVKAKGLVTRGTLVSGNNITSVNRDSAGIYYVYSPAIDDQAVILATVGLMSGDSGIFCRENREDRIAGRAYITTYSTTAAVDGSFEIVII